MNNNQYPIDRSDRRNELMFFICPPSLRRRIEHADHALAIGIASPRRS